MRLQLWTWFVGVMVLTFPRHWVGILGMPRRMAHYDYTDPAMAGQAASVIMSVLSGAILVLSEVLFFAVLIRGHHVPCCASCHGTIEYKTGAAWLEGQSPVYLRAQLDAFANGTRRNDISQQMRNIARNMTKSEIAATADRYARQPPAAAIGTDK
jgi:cytochrome c553